MKITKNIILASNSPRRKEILQNAGYEFEVIVKPTSEVFDKNIPLEMVAEYLAIQKINEFKDFDSNIIIAADTIVIANNEILNKPKDEDEAFEMLKSLSNKMHKVISGVSIKIDTEIISFSDTTEVIFKSLSDEEINYYIRKHKPYDKAGAYGIQEYIGMVGVSSIIGSFYTVMGLPIHKVYEQTKKYIRYE